MNVHVEETQYKNPKSCDIICTLDELEAKGGFGVEACNIVVKDGERTQKFCVRLLKKGNKISCEVSARRLNLPQDVRKRVMGAWYP